MTQPHRHFILDYTMDFSSTDISTVTTNPSLRNYDETAVLDTATALGVAIQAGNVIQLNASGELVLPAGVGLDNIKVVGRDLVVQMPDGTQMIVPDGAIFVPPVIVDGIAVPPLNIAALLIGQEPQPAAGRSQSSGGNFADPVGDIGDSFDLGDLLPPTQLAFSDPDDREIIPALNDEEPTIIIVTPDQPAGSLSATASVDEAALPARGSEPAGSNPASSAETTIGNITFDAPDGLRSITLNGTAVTAVGQTIVTPLGTLTITSIADGSIGYSYTLTDNTAPAASTDIIAVVVTDRDGDTAAASLTINIVDDVPTARNDTDGVPAGTYSAQTGNVVTGVGTTSGSAGADTQGADGAMVSGVRAGTATGAFTAIGTVINGQYGSLTVAADGSYTYTRSAGTPGGVNDIFTYQLTDGDGDISTAILTIAIADSSVSLDMPVNGEAGTSANEAGLPAGSDPTSSSETTAGIISFVASDGPATVTVDGVAIVSVGQNITGAFGMLTITSITNGVIGYSYTLTSNTAGDATFDDFAIVVSDQDGDSAFGTLVIDIVDDVPTAVDDTATQSIEGSSVIIDVLQNDIQGADGVTGAAVALVAGSVTGAGTLVYNGDGTFTYTPAVGEMGTVSFNYQIADGDGDTSTAIASIILTADSKPTVSVTDVTVSEDGLPARGAEPAGTSFGSNSHIGTGSFTIATGGDTLQLVEIQDASGNWVNVTSGGTVNGANGTLTVSVAGGVYSYTYTLTDNLENHPDNAPAIVDGDGTSDAADALPGDAFDVRVTDSDNSISAIDTINVTVLDDGPAITAGGTLPVLTVDESFLATNATSIFAGVFATNYGADGAGTTTYALGINAGATGLVDSATNQAVVLSVVAGQVIGTAGVGGPTVFTLSVAANGGVTLDQVRSVLHTPNTGPNQSTFLSAADLITLTATATDGDGDTASAIANIGRALAFRDDAPTVNATVEDSNAVLLTTQDAQTIGNAFDTDTSTANFGGAFMLASSSYGADGAGTTTWNYVLSVTDVAAGLSSNGVAIILSMNAGVVEGRAGGTLIFSIATEQATGIVTLTQFAEIDHPTETATTAPFDDQIALLPVGKILLSGTVTVTDKDGDSRSDTATLDLGLNIRFADDGPAITAGGTLPVLTVDESFLATNATSIFAGVFATNYGADGAGTTTYALGINAGATGLVDSATNQAVVLSVVAGQVIGTAGVGGPTVFTLSVAANGGVTLDQVRSVLHTPNTGPNQSTFLSAADLITLTATATDGDGDTASAIANIGRALAFRDDAPTVNATVEDSNAVLLTTQDAQTIGNAFDTDTSTANFGGAFMLASSSYGADGAGTTTWNYVLSVTDVAAGLSSNGVAIILSMNAGVVEGRAGGTLIFSIATEQATGIVTLTQFAEIDHPTETATTAPFDDQIALLPVGKILLSGTVTVTDKDGDSRSDTATLDLGLNIRFADDGPAITAGGDNGSLGTSTDAAFVQHSGQNSQARSFDQIRSGNLTTSIVAASLVGLVGAEVAAAATTTDGPRIETLHAFDTGAPDGFMIAGDPRPTVEIDLSGFEPANDFAQSSGDVSSSLRRADDTDFAADLSNQPVRDFSEASYDGSDKAAISDILQNSLSVGGDVVMHNILDIAAATLAVASNDNPATDALADLVANALPEATVDRLIEAFDADIGSFAVNGGGSDNNAYLLNLINQNVGGSQDFGHITVDVLGSQSHDAIALNNG